jgi:hypothetical protein
MVKQDLLTPSKGIPAFLNVVLSLLFISFSSVLSAQGQTQIACNDHVQVSLDLNCQAVIRPSMILEGEDSDVDYTSGYKVKVSGIAASNPYSHPVVTKPGNYSVTVTNPSGNSCWGTMTVEDKLPPQVTCVCPPGNTDPACQFRCTDEPAFIAGTLNNYPKPIVEENCVKVTAQYIDEYIPNANCGAKTIRRTWVYTDQYGNKSAPCVTEYRFLPESLANVVPATNHISLTCGADVTMEGIFAFIKAKRFAELKAAYRALVPEEFPTNAAADAQAEKDATAEATAAAWPTINGVAIKGHVCNLLSAKTDTEVQICTNGCTNSKKVIRVWTILDWCNGLNLTQTQIIKAADEEAPVLAVDDITVGVDAWACVGNFLLPYPNTLTDKCDANPTYSVNGPIGIGVRYDAVSGRYLITGLPKGTHEFTFTAKDCCGNASTDVMTVTVIDNTAPVAVAKQNIIISLTTGGQGDGKAKLFANSVDNGSYDSCTPVYFELRRESDNCDIKGNTTFNNDGHPFDGSKSASSPSYDPDGGQYVTFCCADIDNFDGPVAYGIVKVWMRVWDDANMSGQYGDVVDGLSDNYNETWVDVRVEDKLTPQIICPPNVTISCDDDVNDLKLTGKARAIGTCGDMEVIYTDKEFLGNCRIGYIDRTWRVKNKTSVFCVQRIFVTNPYGEFTESDITWPNDVTTNCADPAVIGQPRWVAGPCDHIGVSVESDTFLFEGNACMKILNKWTVINWCTYDPNDYESYGYFTHVQTIKIVDDVKPTLGSCSDLMYEINDHNDADNDGNRCETKSLMLTQTATDQGQCTSDWLKWIVFVDLNADGIMDYEYSSYLPFNDNSFNDSNGNGIKDRYIAPTGQGSPVALVLPEDIQGNMSSHKVIWKVVDGCGNVSTCTQNFMVVDKKKPTPYCLNISSALMLNGKVELWAVDFNVGSFDNCTAKQNLLYTFNEANPVLSRLNQEHYFKGPGLNATEAEYLAGSAQKWLPSSKSSGMIFDCNDLPSVDVKMTVWDEKLNYDFCVVTLNLADNQGACGTSLTTSVSGTAVSNTGKKIANGEFVIENGIPEMTTTTLSDNTGAFSFPTVKMHYDYTIAGKKNDDYLNGVSTLDIVMMQRHILGINPFTSAYQVIASDVNNDEKVTASDLVEVRKLILGIYSSLPKSGSWRFIDGKQSFGDIFNPFPVKEKIEVSDLSHEMTNQNFIGVKVGDVNGSATGSADNASTEVRNSIVLNAENEVLAAGVPHSIVLNAETEGVYGLQFTLTLRNADLAEIWVGGKLLSDANIAKLNDNTYTVSWNDVAGISGKGLVSINIVPNTTMMTADAVNIHSTVTPAEIYSGEELQTGKLSLRFAGVESVNEFTVFQNEPNPFADKTNISFNLPQAGNATLKVFDVNGKTIYTTTGSFGKGRNSFTLSRTELPASGVMMYQIESGANTVTKKMIGLE